MMMVMMVVPMVMVVMVVPPMVMVVVMVVGEARGAILRRAIRRRSTQLVRSLENSWGVGNGLQKFGERASVHGPIEYIGSHGRLRRGDRRNRTNSRQYAYDCLIHRLLLLQVTGLIYQRNQSYDELYIARKRSLALPIRLRAAGRARQPAWRASLR